MWDTIINLVLNIYGKWADRSVTRITVKQLEFDLIRNDPNSIMVVITAYPSRYYAKLGLSHRGKPTTIKEIFLIINDELKIKAADYNPIKLDHGDYHEVPVIFPVEEELAVEKGNFEIRALDTFDKLFKLKGPFPILDS
jgi:hypothetical protein